MQRRSLSLANRNWWAGSARLIASGAVLALAVSAGVAQGPGGPGGPGQGGPGGRPGGMPPPAPPTAGAKLQITDGSSASYKVNEQFVGISFPNDAIGTSTAVSGTLNIEANGSIGPDSKLVVDLKELKSDQDMRDGYVRQNVLETEKFPTAVFVPTKITGIPTMLPFDLDTAFEMTGNLTIHGVTKPVTFKGIAAFNRNGTVTGKGETSFTFNDFGLPAPKMPRRIMSVGDNITLDLLFRFKRM